WCPPDRVSGPERLLPGEALAAGLRGRAQGSHRSDTRDGPTFWQTDSTPGPLCRSVHTGADPYRLHPRQRDVLAHPPRRGLYPDGASDGFPLRCRILRVAPYGSVHPRRTLCTVYRVGISRLMTYRAGMSLALDCPQRAMRVTRGHYGSTVG